jgi:hypothetical protein
MFLFAQLAPANIVKAIRRTPNITASALWPTSTMRSSGR